MPAKKFNKLQFKKWLINDAGFQIYKLGEENYKEKVEYIKQLIREDIGKNKHFFIDFNNDYTKIQKHYRF